MPQPSWRGAFALLATAALLDACTGYQPPPSYGGDGPPGNGWYREMPDQGSLWEMPQPAPTPRYRPTPEVPPYSGPPDTEPPKISPSPYSNNPAPPETAPVKPGSSPSSSSWFSWFSWFSGSSSPPGASSSDADDCAGRWWSICHFLP